MDKFRLDFIGVGFGRSGSKWLVNCLYEHPEISTPKFNLHTEINYFPEEYEIMGLENYEKKFKKCDFDKVVGELSTLIIFKKRSANLLKKLFPNTKIIIYVRNEKKRAESSYNVAKHYDLVEGTDVSDNPVKEINQKDFIRPFIKEFGKKKVFIFNMENKNKQQELNKLFKFLSVRNFTPPSINERFNTIYTDQEKKIVRKSKYPFIRKLINFSKKIMKNNPKVYYILKRNLHFDYYFQLINHNL